MFLMIDNYDSFTYNVVQYLCELGRPPSVFRNNEISEEEIRGLPIQALVVSPGPCTPREAGVSCRAIAFCAEKKIPVLGICLGHQCIGEVFGGKIVHAPSLMHGKVSKIFHNSAGLFEGIPDGFSATRYHSLVIEKSSCPPVLDRVAHSEDGVIMAVKHSSLPIYGVQFHPESILTEYGREILGNFLRISAL